MFKCLIWSDRICFVRITNKERAKNFHQKHCPRKPCSSPLLRFQSLAHSLHYLPHWLYAYLACMKEKRIIARHLLRNPFSLRPSPIPHSTKEKKSFCLHHRLYHPFSSLGRFFILFFLPLAFKTRTYEFVWGNERERKERKFGKSDFFSLGERGFWLRSNGRLRDVYGLDYSIDSRYLDRWSVCVCTLYCIAFPLSRSLTWIMIATILPSLMRNGLIV